MTELKILKGKKGKILSAIMNAIVPRGGAYEQGAADYDLLPEAEQYIRCLNPLARFGFPFLFSYIEYGALLSRGRVFSRLPEEEAGEYLEGLEESRRYYKRAIILALKMITLLVFYDIDANARVIGYKHWENVDKKKTGKKASRKRSKK